MADDVIDEWKKGWPLVLATFFGVVLGAVYIYGIGLFIQPLEKEFGWSRAQITGGMTIVSIVSVFGAPFVGVLIDRWGPRRFALVGSLLFCAAIAGLSLAGPAIESWWALWVGIALAVLVMSPTLWSAAVSSRFTRSRGLALAVVLTGTGLASSVLPALANMLIASFGWRSAFLALAGGCAAVVFPLMFFFFHDARDQARRTSKIPAGAAVDLPGWTLREGLHRRQFYQLVLAALITTGVVVAFAVHLVPLLGTYGMQRTDAAKLAGLLGIMSVIGRLTVGHLLDRMPGTRVGAVSVLLPVGAALALLIAPGSTTGAAIAIAFLGLAIGGEYDAIIYLSTRYFGLRNYGALFGYVASALQIGVGVGPLLAGAVYDGTGGYTAFLIAVIPLCVIASLMLLTLGRYPDHVRRVEDAPLGAGPAGTTRAAAG